MENTEESGSPSWGASFFMQTTEDVARAVAAAAAAAVAARSPRPSVVYSSKVDNESGLQKLQHQVSKLLKGLSTPPEVKRGSYNPEILTSQKRQWASFQLQSLDHKIWREPSRLFESMVVVGLHPNCDIQALQNLYSTKKSEGSGRFRSALNGQHQSRVGPNLEPQVLFVYPPEKQLPLKYKDLLSFCFPAGVEVHAIERTPSMSELNEILLGQEHLKQSDLSFVFRLQVADDSTLYGCCVLVDEMVQKPSGLISMISEGQPGSMGLSRHILTTRRCYCILSRLPFYELHFGVLNSIFTEERLERLTKNIGDLDLELHGGCDKEDTSEEESGSILLEDGAQCMLNGAVENSPSILSDSVPGRASEDGTHLDSQLLDRDVATLKKNDDGTDEVSVDSDTRKHHGKIETVGETHSSEVCAASVEDGTHLDSQLLDRDAATSKKNDDGTDEVLVDSDTSKHHAKIETVGETHSSEVCDASVDDLMKSPTEKHLPDAVLPLLRYQQYESSESSVSFQGSPADVRNFRSDLDEAEVEEPSFSGQGDFSDHNDILEWAKANNHGSLQIICEYYRLRCPPHGSTIRFHPLDHLHPLEYHRIDESVLHIAGSTIDLKSCNTSLELAEAHYALMAEEEANALSVWAVACLCGSLRLEHVLTLFAAALLEKQIAVVCSNLGLLSASVLSIIPLIRPYQWQSLLMPVLPNDMLEFLDAPVPYIVGVKNKTTDVQSKLTNVTLVDLNKNQVKSSTVPTLPQQKELYQALSPYYAKLVGESYLGKKRPIYEYTDVQVEASKGFLSILRTYLDSLCSNLRSHTITNVQSNDDKVSLLLKESFIESFPSRDRAFMKLFVDTQLFSVHTDFILSFFQKE